MKQRAFTTLETTYSAVILTVFLGATTAGVGMDERVEDVLTSGLGHRMTAESALERMAVELQAATIRGEDKDGDGVLDPGEDLDGDAELRADWTLGDGADAQAELTFNTRTDSRDSIGILTNVGAISEPVSFRLRNGTLVRVEGGDESVLLRQTSNLQFQRDGNLVTISFEVPDGDGTRVYATSVAVRN